MVNNNGLSWSSKLFVRGQGRYTIDIGFYGCFRYFKLLSGWKKSCEVQGRPRQCHRPTICILMSDLTNQWGTIVGRAGLSLGRARFWWDLPASTQRDKEWLRYWPTVCICGWQQIKFADSYFMLSYCYGIPEVKNACVGKVFDVINQQVKAVFL